MVWKQYRVEVYSGSLYDRSVCGKCVLICFKFTECDRVKV
jgi:hypothetical protein